ncbi:MAG: Hpt domain-containing protein [Desulfomonilaceae bacterium]|nr:Hpt domain-containing protein [Desulfomonilaceae bacterium]
MILIRQVAEERGIDEEDVYELLELFVEYTQSEDLEALREAIRVGNHVVARERAHSIKGAALNLKLSEIASLARNLEEKCGSADLEGAEDILAGIASELGVVRDFLEQKG